MFYYYAIICISFLCCSLYVLQVFWLAVVGCKVIFFGRKMMLTALYWIFLFWVLTPGCPRMSLDYLGQSSPSRSRSFKDVLSAGSSSGDSLPSLTQGVFNGVPAVLLSDDEVLKLATPYKFTLVGKFTLGSLNGCKRPDPTRPNMAGSLAAPSTQYATRKAVVEELPFQQPEDKELLNLSSPSLMNSSFSD
ncbi:hypothetical protein M5K25_007023 [Dendrobium thyrsiflorum]|uniref:Uncharacterized protein n=1 Tax=Dendrobium thyrsiflorum TaxID=117978 RepID=A0ABD0VE70_DENTH